MVALIEGRLRRLLLLLLAAALLAACATPDNSLLGADRAAVLSRQGEPAQRFALPTGGERWLYPLGGLQQFVWAVDFDSAGRVVAVTQVRTGENFGRVRIGVDTEADILREFGQPRLKVPFSRIGLVAWLYPYVDSGVWNLEMGIYFDAQGIVRRVESGPDPRFLGGNGKRDQ
jgi:hypothetical protein